MGILKTGLKIQEEGALVPSGCSEGRAELSAQSGQLSVLTDNSNPLHSIRLLPELVHSGTDSAERVDLAPCSISQDAYTELLLVLQYF